VGPTTNHRMNSDRGGVRALLECVFFFFALGPYFLSRGFAGVALITQRADPLNISGLFGFLLRVIC
jgi:hypothetical protein